MFQDNEEIDDVFRSALEPMEAEPSAQFWENAEQQIALRTEKKKRRGFFFLLFLVGGAGLVFAVSYFSMTAKNVTAETTTPQAKHDSEKNNAANQNSQSNSTDNNGNNNNEHNSNAGNNSSNVSGNNNNNADNSDDTTQQKRSSSSPRTFSSQGVSSTGDQFSSSGSFSVKAGNRGHNGDHGSNATTTSSSAVNTSGSTILHNDITPLAKSDSAKTLAKSDTAKALAKADTVSSKPSVVVTAAIDTTDYTLTSFNLDSFPYTPPPARFSRNGRNSGLSVTAFFAPTSVKTTALIEPRASLAIDSGYHIEKLNGFCYTAGVKFGMALGEKWTVHAGLNYSSFSSSIPQVRLVGFSMTMNSFAQYSLITNFGFASFRFEQDTIWVQSPSYLRLTYFGVPLEARYHRRAGRFDFSASAGLSANFLLRHDAHFTFMSGGTSGQTLDATIDGLRRLQLRYTMGLGVGFNLADQFKISADPYHFGSLQTINRGTQYRTRIRGYGLEVGLTYTF